MTRRLFLAWSLSSENRRAAAGPMAGVLESAAGALRPVPEGSEHLTLVFLGERDVPLQDLIEAWAPVREIECFRIRLGGARVFPGSGRPRVVCLDTREGQDELVTLAETARGALETFLPDLAQYRVKPPHVTLARFRRGARRLERRAVEEQLDSSGMADWAAADQVENIELVRSDLSHHGPSYTTVGEIALATG